MSNFNLEKMRESNNDLGVTADDINIIHIHNQDNNSSGGVTD